MFFAAFDSAKWLLALLLAIIAADIFCVSEIRIVIMEIIVVSLFLSLSAHSPVVIELTFTLLRSSIIMCNIYQET